MQIIRGKVHIPNSIENYNKIQAMGVKTKYDKPTDSYVLFATPQNIDLINSHFETSLSTTPQTFKFKTKPWKHQLDALKASNEREGFAYFMEQGTGKTKVIIDEVCILAQKAKVHSVLIICPKSLMGVWEKEIRTHAFIEDFSIDRWKKPSKEKGKFTWNIINIDAVISCKGYDWAEARVNDKCFMVVDESTSIKNVQARRTKSTLALSQLAGYRRILSGTPIANNPLDLYSQMLFLDRWFWNGKSFYSFRNKYGIMGGYQGKEVIGFKDQEDLTNIISESSFRVVKDQVLDIPPKVYQKRLIELPPKAKTKYNEIVKEYKEAKQEEDPKKRFHNAMAAMIKCHQVCGGFLDGEAIHDAKLKELDAILEQIGHRKILIWCKYKAEIKAIEKRLKPLYNVMTFFGETKTTDRENAIESFENGTTQVLILQYQAGGVGLTLNAASYSVYYSGSYSYMERTQSEDRCHRGGQTKSVTYIDFICPATVDERVKYALGKKKNLADFVMENLKQDESIF